MVTRSHQTRSDGRPVGNIQPEYHAAVPINIQMVNKIGVLEIN